MTRASEFAFVFESHRAAPRLRSLSGIYGHEWGSKKKKKKKRKKENQTAELCPSFRGMTESRKVKRGYAREHARASTFRVLKVHLAARVFVNHYWSSFHFRSHACNRVRFRSPAFRRLLRRALSGTSAARTTTLWNCIWKSERERKRQREREREETMKEKLAGKPVIPPARLAIRFFN